MNHTKPSDWLKTKITMQIQEHFILDNYPWRLSLKVDHCILWHLWSVQSRVKKVDVSLSSLSVSLLLYFTICHVRCLAVFPAQDLAAGRLPLRGHSALWKPIIKMYRPVWFIRGGWAKAMMTQTRPGHKPTHSLFTLRWLLALIVRFPWSLDSGPEVHVTFSCLTLL